MEVTQITRKYRISLFNTFTKAFGELEAELLKREEEIEARERNETNREPETEPDQHEHITSLDGAKKAELEKKVSDLSRVNEELRARLKDLETAEASKHERTLRSRSVSRTNKENIESVATGLIEGPNHTAGLSVGIQTDLDSHVSTLAQYEELTKKYEQMRQQVKHYREAHSILTEKYRRNKAVWKQWVEQDKLRRQKSERLKAQLNAKRGGTLTTPAAEVEVDTEGSTGEILDVTPKRRAPVTSSPASHTTPIAQEGWWDSSPPPRTRDATGTTIEGAPIEAPEALELVDQESKDYDSDHTTDGEDGIHAAALNPTSRDDEGGTSPTLPKQPAGVKTEKTARALDDDDDDDDDDEGDEDDAPVYIKSEPRSSNSAMDHFAFTQQSLDLDDIGPRPQTPRQRKYMSNYQSRNTRGREHKDVKPIFIARAIDNENNRVEGQDTLEFTGAHKASDFRHAVPTLPAPQLSGIKVSGIQVDSHPADKHPPAPTTATKTPATKTRQLTLSGYFEDHTRPQPDDRDAAQTASVETSTRNQKRHVTTPTKKLRHTSSIVRESDLRKTRAARDLEATDLGIGLMTEDGTNGAKVLVESLPTGDVSAKKEILGKLLDTPPAKTPSITHLRKGTEIKGTTPVRPSVDDEGNGGFKFKTPVATEGNRGLKFRTPVATEGNTSKRNIPVTDPPISKRSKFITGSERKAARPPSPERRSTGSGIGRDDNVDHKKGLRARRTQDLSVSDFAVNAQKTGGLNHAYHEVIRKRDERKCIPGCLGSCCKELRDFFTATGMREVRSNAPKWRSSPPAPGSSQVEHKEDAEKSSQEEFRVFANRFAKHRNMFDRRNSPPGFWDAEFPDTQDRDARKELARKEERKRVEDMRREADRGDGRWLYRDET